MGWQVAKPRRQQHPWCRLLETTTSVESIASQVGYSGVTS
ncbi:hypothetical protein D187_007865 [Cystobacter fuscus DSM 2262]|uniref:Uncharacterized protein n=1 Tax=Cystobacter fuscus (strain ATCC 25194 / DSM 2262 / NBRC 100088 / M29) TaxID=1242864 RepID=S9QJ81_CYSF2|nr:hypothetical protein D187_007865 [Cystobacter fuscus DSM 2262]